MRKTVVLPDVMIKRITLYLFDKGFNFTELVKRAVDEFLKKEGY